MTTDGQADLALLEAGMRIAGWAGLPLTFNGRAVYVSPDMVPDAPEPAPVAPSDEEPLSPMETARRVCFLLHTAGRVLAPLLTTLTDGAPVPANSNAGNVLVFPAAAIHVEPLPTSPKPDPMARATESFADAADLKSFGANAWLLDDILIERIEGRFAIRPRFGDAASAEHATTEGEALTQARRMAAAHTDGDTP